MRSYRPVVEVSSGEITKSSTEKVTLFGKEEDPALAGVGGGGIGRKPCVLTRLSGKWFGSFVDLPWREWT
jgi:hypothetical protein